MSVEKGYFDPEAHQVMDRDDICERISRQIQNMDGKELMEFCRVNFGGEDHRYVTETDCVEFELE